MTSEEPLACWEKQLVSGSGDVFLCALPTGHAGDCQPYADETTVFGFDGAADGAASLVRAIIGDDDVVRLELLATAPPHTPQPHTPQPDDPAAFVRHYLGGWTAAVGRWIHIGSTDQGIEFVPPPADAEPVLDVALWERARSVTFPDFDARSLLERIDTLLVNPEIDPDLGPDAARWSPDDGVTW
jgi:hypothetical protein